MSLEMMGITWNYKGNSQKASYIPIIQLSLPGREIFLALPGRRSPLRLVTAGAARLRLGRPTR